MHDLEQIRAAMPVLPEHMEPAKMAKFLAARPVAGNDYLKLRERLFAGETVDSLTAKIRAFETANEKAAD